MKKDYNEKFYIAKKENLEDELKRLEDERIRSRF